MSGAGAERRTPPAWTASGGTIDIGTLLPEGEGGNTLANAVVAGGRLIARVSGSPFFGEPHPFVWTRDAGIRPVEEAIAAAGLSVPEGLRLTNILAASADGTVLLGQAQDELGTLKSFVVQLPLSAYGP